MHPAGRQALVDAADKPEAIERLFRGDVINGGLWFDDATCANQFGTAGQLRADELTAFAKCLAELHLQASAREDALGDVVVFTYPPGFEVEARVVQESAGPHLTWIGYESRRAVDPLVPTITADALAALRVSGDNDGPIDPSVAASLELDPTKTMHAQYAWIRLCIDETGAVTQAHVFELTSERSADAFAAAAQRWTFRPFTIQGSGMPVCSMVRMSYPPKGAPPLEVLPLPPPRSKRNNEALVFAEGVKDARLIEGKRISGEKTIVPDDQTKVEIQKRTSRVTGSFRICLSETGAVESVLPLRSTGFAAYDRRIMGGVLAWVYSPYQVNDVAVPVCTRVTFIYHQR